jgi:pyruvate kinase
MLIQQKKVKIVATIGPSSASQSIIEQLILNGVNVFRLNFSHGNHDSHRSAIKMIRCGARQTGCDVAILADLQGPKIRTRSTDNNSTVSIPAGSVVRITAANVTCTSSIIAIDYPTFSQEIDAGQQIIINDGAIRLEVLSKEQSGDCIAVAVTGGEYSSHKGVNLPNVNLKIPSLTQKDLHDLEIILEEDVQFIALSFVRNANDVKALRSTIDKKRNDIKIIAKIEKPEAAECIGEILDCSDGIMVARGDLGVEMTPYTVPVVQKDLIRMANATGKIVIVATQMLESMIHQKMPTRAEATDVANAIIDGTDAIMLSGETAVGAYPQDSVFTMSHIAQSVETSMYARYDIRFTNRPDHSLPHAICEAAMLAGVDSGGIPLCVYTISGTTALYLAKLRYKAPVYAFSPSLQVVKMLSIAWNTTALQLPFAHSTTELHNDGESLLLQKGWVQKGDLIGIISGTNGLCGATNSFRIKRVGTDSE